MLAQVSVPAPVHRPAFDTFEVATIKPAAPEPGRVIRMQSAHRFYAKGHTLKSLIGAAYSLNPRAILGGPAWLDSDRYDILAGTPGEIQPNLVEQMTMLRQLLADRFQLAFHREEKEMATYALTVGKLGPKLTESAMSPEVLPELTNVVYPDHVRLPARNATMAQFVAMMQRAVLDRPMVDRTGLSGHYDFTLEWAADETQFGGALPKPVTTDDAPKPDLFAAVQQQLGLKLTPARGLVSMLVIDGAERPSAN